MPRLLIPTALLVGGVIGLVFCLFAFIEGDDYPLQALISLLFAVLGGRELRFELFPEVGEADQR